MAKTPSELTEELHRLQVEVMLSLKATIKAIQTTYKVNLYINIIIIVLGILLIAVAVAQSVLQGVDPFSVTLGGLGVASLVAVFLVNPQRRLQDNLCKISQIDIILSNFIYEYDRFLDSTKGTSKIKELEVINKEGERIVSFAVRSIKELLMPQQKSVDGNENNEPHT